MLFTNGYLGLGIPKNAKYHFVTKAACEKELPPAQAAAREFTRPNLKQVTANCVFVDFIDVAK